MTPDAYQINFHPIIDRPYEWKIVEFRFSAPDGEEPLIDLWFERRGTTRRLRFHGVRDVQLERGFPASPGLVIEDVSADQLDGLGVRVTDLEAGRGGIHFWARDVVDLDA